PVGGRERRALAGDVQADRGLEVSAHVFVEVEGAGVVDPPASAGRDRELAVRDVVGGRASALEVALHHLPVRERRRRVEVVAQRGDATRACGCRERKGQWEGCVTSDKLFDHYWKRYKG